MDLATLIVIVSLSVILYLVITTIRAFLYPPVPVVYKYQPRMMGEITLDELSKYDGRDPFRPILFAVQGQIYDVTEARSFYGPGGGYALFAGKEIARALGKMQIKDSECTADTSDFSAKETQTLNDWVEKFNAKYQIVGKIIPEKLLTLKQLAVYDGTAPDTPIYLCVRGTIFDVSAGKDFYGPDGAYPFAGKECARALAKYSTELEDCNDNLEGCSLAEMDALRDWEARFYSKYPLVGKLVKE